MIMRMMARNSISESLQSRIDASVKEIATDAYDVALRHMRENREACDKIVEVLMEKETMGGDEFREILSRYATIPQSHLDAVEKQKRPDNSLLAA
jgi:cell division protease FtsH